MSKIVKEVFYVFCFSLFMAVFVAVARAGECGNCAVWVPESQTIHVSSLRVGREYFWVDFKLVNPLEEGIFFSLDSYGYSEQADDNCSSVWIPEAQTVHIPCLKVGNGDYWANLHFRSELRLFQLTDWCQLNLKVFGPAFNAVDGFGDWRENLAETAKFSNFAMISSDGASVREIAAGDAEKISEALRLGMNRTLVIATNILFVADFNSDGALTSVRLRPDYRERIQRYSLYLHLYGSRAPWAFYVLDEPYWAAIQCGMSIGEMRRILNKAIAAIKETFPNSKTANGIAVTHEDLEQESIFGFPVPPHSVEEYGMPNFDIIAVYCYWPQYRFFYPGSTLEDSKKVFRKKYLGNAKDNLLPGQKIVIVPGTFAFPGQEIPTEDYLNLANFYWNIARSDSQVVGIVPFLWPSSKGAIGLNDLPKEVQQTWEGIGKKIISRGTSLR